MAQLCFLGTGGSVATEKRDNTALAVSSKEALLLIDCPGGVIQKLKRLGFDPRSVSSILVTHIHPDHIYGLPSFVHSLMLDECLIELYGSEETIRFCQDLLDLFHLREEKIKTRIRFMNTEENKIYRLSSSLIFSAMRIPHDSSSLAYRFRYEDERKDLTYSGDTPLFPSLFKSSAGIDYLIHDCSAPSRFFRIYPSLKKMHTHSLGLGKFAQEAKVRCLIPCHFFGELDFSLAEIEKEIRENFEGKLIIPQDFVKIDL
jgi:ribonuclease Z